MKKPAAIPSPASPRIPLRPLRPLADHELRAVIGGQAVDGVKDHSI